MLTVATLGMLTYGGYSVGWAIVDVVRGAHLKLWAEAGLVVFGLLLMLSAPLVRIRMLGGLEAAFGSMLGLQGLAVHKAVHLDNRVAPQAGRAALALVLAFLAYAGGK